jgi:hypothetical protein
MQDSSFEDSEDSECQLQLAATKSEQGFCVRALAPAQTRKRSEFPLRDTWGTSPFEWSVFSSALYLPLRQKWFDPFDPQALKSIAQAPRAVWRLMEEHARRLDVGAGESMQECKNARL